MNKCKNKTYELQAFMLKIRNGAVVNEYAAELKLIRH